MSTDLTLRLTKGNFLTAEELDDNFTALDSSIMAVTTFASLDSNGSIGVGSTQLSKGNHVKHIMPYPTFDIAGFKYGLTSEINTTIASMSAVDFTLDLGGHTYLVDASITLNNKTSLRITNGTLIKTTDWGGGSIFRYIDCVQCSNITFDNIYADGQAQYSNPSAVFLMIEDCSNIVVTNSRFFSLKYAVMATGTARNSDIEVSNNSFSTSSGNTDGAGTGFYGNSLVDNAVVSDNIMKNWNHLVLSGNATGWSVTGNNVYKTGDSSIYLKGWQHTIAGNVVIDAGKDGIKIRPTSTGANIIDEGFSSIIGNFVSNPGLLITSGGTCIHAYGKQNTITGNVCVLDSDGAMVASGCSGIRVRGNSTIVSSNSITGVYSGPNSVATTSSGIAFSNDDADDPIGNADNTIVMGNSINQVERGIVFGGIDSSFTLFRVHIASNTISTCETGLELVPPSLLRSGKMSSISFDNNLIDSCQLYGLRSKGGGTIHMTGNNFSNMSGDVIRLQSVNDGGVFLNNRSDGTGNSNAVNIVSPAEAFNTKEIGNSWNAKPSSVTTLTTKTSNYTATVFDEVVLVDATSGNITISLPTSVGNGGKNFKVKKVDASANTVTIDPNSSQTIDGVATKVITTQYAFINVVSDSNNWFEI